MQKIVIKSNHTIEEYNKRYKNVSYRLLKFKDKEVKDFDNKNGTVKGLLTKHRWWFINGTYYEAPRFIHTLKIGYKIAIGAVVLTLVGLTTYHAARMLLPSYSVSFSGEQKDTHLVMIGNNIAKRGEDYKLKFNIDYMYELSHENIHVYIDGRERTNCWTFRYQTNVKNELTIKKEFVHGDITIKAMAHYKTTTPFLYGIENDAYVANNLNVEVLVGDEKKKVEKMPIPQLSGELAYPINEDDCLEVKFKIKDGVTPQKIDDRLWFRTNARYAKVKTPGEEDYDFEKKVIDEKNVTFIVPHFIIRDNCDLRINPNIPV